MSVSVMSPAIPAPISFYTSIPPHITETDHVQRSLVQLRSKSKGLEQYIFLNGLKERDPSLFYQILLSNIMEIIPILYTPTVGDACSFYSHIWRHPEGLYISIKHKGHIRQILRAYPAGAKISVVTDGSRILGLGDLGANGLPISIGKLDLYVAGAGIRPSSTLPICLDVGTNTKKFIEDPLYIGVRQTRPVDSEMDEFMEEFMSAISEVFPELVVQFEDFSTENAFKYLDLFRSRYRVFNDDVSAVVLSGFLNAARISSAASGLPLSEHRILFFGAGSSGIGVAKQLVSFFTELGLSVDEAKKQIYTVDSKGLITADREGLQEHKKFFARTDYQGPALKNLVDIVNHIKPTALLGLSTIGGAFTEEVVKAMSAMNNRPIIFPLSNPVSKCELSFQDAINWTNGRVVFASGSPYNPIIHEGTTYEAGQGNNMYMFPGIGLGVILSKAKHITDAMVEKAAIALSSSLNEEENSRELVYPRLDRIRDISAQVALAVAREAQKEDINSNIVLRSLNDNEALRHIKGKMW
ncbi:malate dehydrogenase [Lentinula lateritia]|nr:malate dehydrogenase [Lentinula lateritia]